MDRTLGRTGVCGQAARNTPANRHFPRRCCDIVAQTKLLGLQKPENLIILRNENKSQ